MIQKLKKFRYSRQVLELPWPVAPRDVLLHRKFTFDPVERTVTVNYRSIVDDRCPITPGMVRADSPHSMWRFRSIPPCEHPAVVRETQLVDVHSQTVIASEKSSTPLNFIRKMLRSMRSRFVKQMTGYIEISVRFARRFASKGQAPALYHKVHLGQQKQDLSPSSAPPAVTSPPAPSNWLARGLQQVKGAASSKGSVRASAPVIAVGRGSSGINNAGGSRPSPVHVDLAAIQCSTAKPPTIIYATLNPNKRTDSSFSSFTRAGRSGNKSQSEGPVWRGVSTVIEFESFVDSKGSIPPWFINYMQR